MKYKFNLALVIGGVVVLASFFIAINLTGMAPITLGTQINVAATAQAIQFHNRETELEATRQAQDSFWQAEIKQRRHDLDEFKQESQAQQAELQQELTTLQGQIEPLQSNIARLEPEITQLNETIQQAETTHQMAMATLQADMERSQKPLQQAIELAYAKLQDVYRQQSNLTVPPLDSFATPPTATPTPPETHEESSKNDDHDEAEATPSADDHEESSKNDDYDEAEATPSADDHEESSKNDDHDEAEATPSVDDHEEDN